MSLSIFIIYNLKDNQAQNINLPSASTRRDVTMAIRIAIAPIRSGTIFTIYAKNKNYYKTNSGSREKTYYDQLLILLIIYLPTTKPM